MATLQVLGPVQVVGDDGAVALPAKHRRLLAALVVAEGRSRGVDDLVDAVWGERAPPSARKLLQVYVSQLRKALPPGIELVTHDGGYALALPESALDARAFERLLADAAEARRDGNAALVASLLDRALALWRGPAYGELAYEEVARGEAERLEELRLVTLEQRLDAQLAAGQHLEAVGSALALAEEHPLRERLHELAMLALYRCGRQADALEHYACARARLREELGLEPSPSLRQLQGQILQQDRDLETIPLPSAAVATLPLSPNPLVGRTRELEQIGALLAAREARLIVLTGAGGSGKTRLALEAARAAAASFANGVALVGLAPLRDPALVVPAIAQALDVPLDGGDEPLATLAQAVAARELLLVVDNAEHVRDAAPAYAELAARAPRLTLLVTSRAVLHVSGERVFPVTPLDHDDAVELFAQRASLLAAPSAPGSDDDIGEICRRVDGLPLAIELAAARARTLTPRALRERLDARLSVLTGGPRDLPARQQTLRETIGWSVDLLSEPERRVFARLAVFPAGASLAAAEDVCGANLDTLSALVDDHLLRREDVDGEPRFGMLETIREYALELLGAERPAVESRMAAHLAEVLEVVELEARLSSTALSRLDPELDNVRVAVDTASAAGDAQLELRLVGGLWRYCWVRGIAAEGLRRIETALAAEDGAATAALAKALQGGAGLAWSLGDLERAKELARRAISVAAEAGSLWDEMAANTVLGIVANNEGDRNAARRHHARSIELAEQLGLEPFAQKLNLGIVALDSGDYEDAHALFEDVLAHHRRAENEQGIGFALINLGVVHHARGDHLASLEAFREGGACFERIGFRAHVAHAQQGIAAFEASAGRFLEAARLLGRSRSELDEVGAAETDFAEGMVEWTKGHTIEALGAEAFEAAYSAGRDER